MIDLKDKNQCPVLEEIGEYVGNPVFMQFCVEVKETYNCSEKMEYSSCSMEPGWNIKFKKSGKTLCTIYPGNFILRGGREKRSRRDNFARMHISDAGNIP